ncbi:MAG: hypothetical protein M0P16_11755, partial [Syntrophales bacterium]|nr:hypothetical protein [Syntrophales bacterium]
MESLLGSFYSRIRGSQEDIASAGLCYLLERSDHAKEAVYSIIRAGSNTELKDLSFRSQVSGENQERPDLVGTDAEGRERLIIEAKFMAGLTKNQPVQYMKRVERVAGVLLFVCPSQRMQSLKRDLYFQIHKNYDKVIVEDKQFHIRFADLCSVILISWEELLRIMELELTRGEERELLSDLHQIRGLCEKIESESIMPISSADLSPSIGKRVLSYYQIVDKVFEELKNEPVGAVSAGMKRTAQYGGYSIYFQVRNLNYTLALNFDFWQKYAGTPFWFTFQDDYLQAVG